MRRKPLRLRLRGSIALCSYAYKLFHRVAFIVRRLAPAARCRFSEPDCNSPRGAGGSGGGVGAGPCEPALPPAARCPFRKCEKVVPVHTDGFFPPHCCSPQKEPKKPRFPPNGAFSYRWASGL